MNTVCRRRERRQGGVAAALLAAVAFGTLSAAVAAEKPADDEILEVPASVLGTKDDPTLVDDPADMKPYRIVIPGTEASYEMIPVPGGTFLMGSPPDEEGREDDEGPQVKVKVDPFWIGKHEVRWNEYDIWNYDLDIQRRKQLMLGSSELDKLADAITRPTPPYTDMTFDSGHDGYPAICVTQLGAKVYSQWLSTKTGHYYRLPTEAEWEYAARAGTTTPYSFGSNPEKLDEYGWHFGNAGEDREVNYHQIGQKKPNPWGLYDMHGNVEEWCLDQYDENWYAKLAEMAEQNGGVVENPVNAPKTLYPRVTRGGSWDDEPEECRSAARGYSEDWWKIQDPQLPKSVWYHTDATFVGFRLLRPLKVPTKEERAEKQLDPIIPEDARTKNAGR